MIISYDVGSLPLKVDEQIIFKGARKSQTLLPLFTFSNDDPNIFEKEIVSAFVDKLNTGIDVPNYPQFRDMNLMFLELIHGINKEKKGYVASRTLSVKPNVSIPEVDVIKRNISRIKNLADIDKVLLKVCVTGPYTLASFFKHRSPKLFEEFGDVLVKIVKNSIHKTRTMEVNLLCIDEPVLGFINDPLLDYGSDGRKALIEAWDEIYHEATSRSVLTSIHLHETSNDLFWDVKNLKIIESHVDDPLYTLESTKPRLDKTDKFLKASISITIFDRLIEAHLRSKEKIVNIEQKIGDVWTDIQRARLDPSVFIEDEKVLQKRLRRIVDRFGLNRVRYAGPECGMKSWPSYKHAMQGLSRVSNVVRKFNTTKI